MNLYSFIYLCFIYFFFTLYNSTDIINYKFQILFSGILISTFGIAHGSIDNFLVKKKYDLNNFEFYSLYLVSIVLYIIVWLISPKIAFLSFLLLSAYHFGESHFSCRRRHLCKSFTFYRSCVMPILFEGIVPASIKNKNVNLISHFN